MSRHDQPSALRPEILAARVFASLVARFTHSGEAVTNEMLAGWACDAAAAFIAEWKRRDPQTAEPNGMPVDVDDDTGVAIP